MNCPLHNCKLLPVPSPSGRGHELRCPVIGCEERSDNYLTPSAASAKLPGLDGGKQSRALRWSEADTERTLNEGLALKQAVNLSTVVRYAYQTVTCPACKHTWQRRPTGGTGASLGVPDRLVAFSWMPAFLFVGVEDKGSHTPFTNSANDEAQKRLAASRRIVVCREWDDMAMVEAFVKAMLAPALKAGGK